MLGLGKNSMIEIGRVELTERELEALLKENSDLIEEGLKFIDNRIAAGRGSVDIVAVGSGDAGGEASGNEPLTTDRGHEP